MMVVLNERATINAEIWSLKKGRLGRYAGWQEWPGYIGFNWLDFGLRSPTYRPRKGRFRAIIYATDEGMNEAVPKRVDFTIR